MFPLRSRATSSPAGGYGFRLYWNSVGPPAPKFVVAFPLSTPLSCAEPLASARGDESPCLAMFSNTLLTDFTLT